MGKIKKCVNCGRVPVKSFTLCADCLAACEISREYKKIIISKAAAIERANAAVIISEKNTEIEKLKYQLRLNQRILRHIFREYQILQGIKAVDIVV